LKRLLVLFLVAGCGRIGFDALSDGGPSATCERRGYPNVPWLLDNRYNEDIALVDVDHDGALDLVAISGFATPFLLSVRHGNGDGTFAAEVTYPASANLRRLAVADLDGDGLVDIAAFSTTAAQISIWWNNGGGAFADEQMIAIGSNPSDLALADIDGDGAPDLVTAEANGVVVYRNLGGRTFGVPSMMVLDGAQARVAVGDLDGDGHPDIVSVDAAGTSYWVASATPPRQYPTNPMLAYTVLGVSDLDGDGRDDVVLADQGVTIAFAHNRGDGTFDPETEYTTNGDVGFDLAFGDFNRDGKRDVLLADQGEDIVELFLNHGDGTFDMRDLHAGAQTSALAIGDIDGDGKLDLAATVFQGISLVLGFGDSFDQPTEYAVAGTTTGWAVADLDGDGHIDVVAASTASSTVWYGTGDGTFTDPHSTIGLRQIAGPEPVDVDGDGRPDLVGGGAQTILVARGTAGRTFAAAVMYTLTADPVAVVAADVDGDHHPDLIVRTAGEVDLLANQGDGTFAAPVTLSTFTLDGDRALVAGDFDHDGKIDIAYLTQTPMAVAVLRGNGDRTFAASAMYPLSTFAQLFAGDVDGDGFPDLMTVDTQITLLRFAGGSLVAGPVMSVDPLADPTMVAPFGGHPSLVGANQIMNTIDIYDGHGDGTFGPGRHYLAGAYPAAAYAIDLDGKDGLDFLILGYDRLSVALVACP
jgi:hypothetical protein